VFARICSAFDDDYIAGFSVGAQSVSD